MEAPSKIKTLQSMGVRASCNYLLYRFSFRIKQRTGLTTDKELVPVKPKDSLHPLWFRRDSSDMHVYWQIFKSREYSCIDDIKDVKYIVDCGANIGYSSAYFLSRFEKAQVIAVEPEAKNYEMLQRNTRAFGSRIRTVCAGIWSHATGLSVSAWRDGGEWAFTVFETPADQEPDVKAISLDNIFQMFGDVTIDILKIDIEGSEKVIFAEGYEKWLPRVRNIVIELHGPDCEAIVDKALHGRKHTKERFNDELTIYRFS